MRRNQKLWIAGAFILAGAMLTRFAWSIAEPFSMVIVIIGAILFLGGIFYFAANFSE